MHADRGRPRKGWLIALPWVLLGLGIAGQLLAPFTQGLTASIAMSIGLLGCSLAVAVHAVSARRWGWAGRFFAITLVTAFAVEWVSHATDFPYGGVVYSGLGPTLMGVPILIPLSWLMLVYPGLLAAQRLSTERLGTALLAALTIGFAGLAVDANLTASGLAHWPTGQWNVPGTAGLPLQDLLGRLLVAFVLVLVLDRVRRKVAKDGVPTLLLSWLYGWGVVSTLVVLGQPGTAAWVTVGMGLVVVPWWWRVWSEPQW